MCPEDYVCAICGLVVPIPPSASSKKIICGGCGNVLLFKAKRDGSLQFEAR